MPCLDAMECYKDHDYLTTFVKSSRRALERDEGMEETPELLRFLCQHVSRSTYQTTFLKCDSDECSHCTAHPVQAMNAVRLLHSLGNRLFTPAPSAHLPGHYLTYLECRTYHSLGKSLLPIDAGLPSGEPKRCPYGCTYAFVSARDADRHICSVHPSEWKQYWKASSDVPDAVSSAAVRPVQGELSATDSPATERACHRCQYDGCGSAFTSYYQLLQHKKAQGHQLKRGRSSKN